MIIAQLPAQYGIMQTATGTASQNLSISTYGANQGFVGADPATPTLFSLGVESSSIVNGVPLKVVWAGYYLSHGASQTLKVTMGVAAYAAAPSYTALVTPSTASGTLTAATYYPFMVEASLIGWSGTDSAGVAAGGTLSGTIRTVVGDVPTLNAAAATANITGITFGNNLLPAKATAVAKFLTTLPVNGGSAAYPISGLNTLTGANPAFLIVPQFINGVSDTSAVVFTTAFYVAVD